MNDHEKPKEGSNFYSKASKIAVVTTGRFHVLDLARELSHLGYDVSFYSIVPRWRTQLFGLPADCHRSLLALLFPLVALWYICPRFLRHPLDRALECAADAVAALRLRPCDVFVGMSGLCVKSARKARQKYGANIFIERGSRHILSQKEILDAIPAKRTETASRFTISRELWGYDYADVIVIPSRHVEQSFVERGISRSKLFRNPYGVDLSIFQPTEKPSTEPTVLFVGTWSLRKGCDVLWSACEKLNCLLVHVGPTGDAPVPISSHFLDVRPVDQTELRAFYARAHVLVHASREEGLSLVLAQALACGLPVVCTDRTGGADLREFLSDPKYVMVVPSDDVQALENGIRRALTVADSQHGLRDILGAAREKLSWRAYGRRYTDELVRRVNGKPATRG